MFNRSYQNAWKRRSPGVDAVLDGGKFYRPERPHSYACQGELFCPEVIDPLSREADRILFALWPNDFDYAEDV